MLYVIEEEFMLLFFFFLLYLGFSLSLSQIQPIFVSFVAISSVLRCCFKNTPGKPLKLDFHLISP